MYTTREDARKKWCPFVRIAGSNRIDNTLNDGFTTAPASYHCIVEECMQWREVHSYSKTGMEQAEKNHGYCGLSGKPEYE